LALRLAEEEQRRVIEGELRLQEIEKKQRELARQQKFEEEQLERSRRLESLKQETDRKLAEVRQKAVLTTLEAQLEENIDDNKIIDMDLVSDDEDEIYEQQTEDIPLTYLYEDEIPPPYIEDPNSIQKSFQHDYSYPVFTPPNEVNPAFSSATDINVRNPKDYKEKIIPDFSVTRTNPPHSWKLPASSRSEPEVTTKAQIPSNIVPQPRTLIR
jgi:hypothetical protein